MLRRHTIDLAGRLFTRRRAVGDHAVMTSPPGPIADSVAVGTTLPSLGSGPDVAPATTSSEAPFRPSGHLTRKKLMSRHLNPRARGAVSVVMAVGLTLGLAAVTAPAASASPGPVQELSATDYTAEALPTAQIDGVAWSQVIAGDTVFVGGSFTTARPAGAAAGVSTVPRSNMMAYNVTTGVMTAFAPALNGQVRTLALSPDRSVLYAGGDFTTVNGAARSRIAAFSTATGALITTFAPTLSSTVRTIVATATTVYAGGNFVTANAKSRQRLAAFDTAGTLLNWNPGADRFVSAMLMSPSGRKLIVGGSFLTVAGQPNLGMAGLDPVTGLSTGFAANQSIRNSGDGAGITSLSTDGTFVYGSGFVDIVGAGNLEGTFKADGETGAVVWMEDCRGDTYSTFPTAASLYTAGHSHDCSSVGGWPQSSPATYQRGVAFTSAVTGTLGQNIDWRWPNYQGRPSPSIKSWFPDFPSGTFTGQGQGPWNVTGDGRYLVLGGEFPKVNFKAQQGLVRFAVRATAPNKLAPQGNTQLTPTLYTRAGKVVVSWESTWHRDQKSLTYTIIKDGNKALPMATVTAASTFWDLPRQAIDDPNVAVGSTHTYQVIASDSYGNSVTSGTASIVVSGVNAPAYVDDVLKDGADLFWRLGEPSGPTAADFFGGDAVTLAGGVVRNQVGAITGDPDRATLFDGGTAEAGSTRLVPGPQTFTAEAWFRTTSTTGGKIVGFGSQPTGNSASYDRHLFMDAGGRVYFGNWEEIGSTQTYNDGEWHHIAGTLSDTGSALYVDGVKVAQGSRGNSAQYVGYWRIGSDTPWRGSSRFAGTIDDVAIYPTALSGDKIARHYLDSGHSTVANVPPVAEFSVDVDGAEVGYSAAGSSDPDGRIVSYDWDFGDGTRSTESGGRHTYQHSGDYPVILTVTDDKGATATVTHLVAVRIPGHNLVPVVKISHTENGLTAQLDGTGTTDPDGTITNYEWDFGDGATGTGATVSHTYAQAGTYRIKLTVTDDGGTRTWKFDDVTVSAPVNAAPIAAFTSAVDGLDATLDAGGSHDPDGRITEYAWNFGDGSAVVRQAGATASHRFAVAGTYTVTLTVTDDRGATISVTHGVTVTAPGAQSIAADAFGRTSTSGWGPADQGGTWAASGGGANVTVSGGKGRLTVPKAGGTVGSALAAVSSTSTDIRATISPDKVDASNGSYLSVVGRRVSATADYRAKVRFGTGNKVGLSLSKLDGGVETPLGSQITLPLTYAAGSAFNVRVQVFGTSPTTVRAKVWAAGSPEPSGWQLNSTDTTAALQVPGGIGFLHYLSGSSTVVPVTISVSELTATSLAP